MARKRDDEPTIKIGDGVDELHISRQTATEIYNFFIKERPMVISVQNASNEPRTVVFCQSISQALNGCKTFEDSPRALQHMIQTVMPQWQKDYSIEALQVIFGMMALSNEQGQMDFLMVHKGTEQFSGGVMSKNPPEVIRENVESLDKAMEQGFDLGGLTLSMPYKLDMASREQALGQLKILHKLGQQAGAAKG